MKEATIIQSNLKIKKWNDISKESIKEGLLSSSGYFHDSYIVKKIYTDDTLELLFNTSWGSYVLLRLKGNIH